MKTSKLALVAALGLFALLPKAEAGNYRYGFSVGYGGEGLDGKYTGTDGFLDHVGRTDGPLMIDIFFDKFLSDTFFLNFAHSRGISVSPLTSGISFTGVSGLWYLMGPPVSLAAGADSSLLVKRFAPYAGISAGFAQASMNRDNDLVPNATGSGLYLGIKAGFDYPVAPGTGLKPEFVYASTSYASSFSSSKPAVPPPVLSQLSIQCSWYFDF